MRRTRTVRSERLRRVRDRAAELPAYRGAVGEDIEAFASSRLLERSGRMAAPRIDAFNMATVYGARTDGCGSVGCLAGLTVLEYQEEAAAARRRLGREHNRPVEGIDVLEVAGEVLGLDPATRYELFCGASSGWVDDLGSIPKEVVLAAADRILAGRRGAAIWGSGPGAGERHPHAITPPTPSAA